MRQLRNRRGIVGIEAAIVLIAFVVIAAAFSYVVINMGFFATQKTKDVINEGIEESTGSMQLDGTVIARTDDMQYKDDEVIDTGDGTTGFTGTLANKPLVLDSLTITATVTGLPVTITDALDGTPGDGNLADAPASPTVTGTINYVTGVWALTWTVGHPDDTTDITADYAYTGAGNIRYIVFPVKLSVGKGTVDLGADSTVITVYLPDATRLDIYDGVDIEQKKLDQAMLDLVAVDSAKSFIYNGNGNSVLEFQEKAFIILHLGLGNEMKSYQTVKIEVKPGRGAALTVVRTAPGGLLANEFVDLG